MGTKIKPAFKSDFVLVSEGWHLFRVVEPKIEVVKEEDRKEKDGITNDRNFIVRSAVEGGDEDGIEIMEYFANHSKKEFGLSRLAGLMIKTGVLELDPSSEIDVDMMRTEKFESKFKMSLPKRLFGGRVRHTKSSQKKEGSDEPNVFANIVEVVTQKEYNDVIAKQGDKGPKTKAQTTAGTEKAPESKEKDPWA
uniref:Uncharacterized protein n=1 Tax=viral metagenome TaxID=1070528 RepID=A0A6M3LUV1_9ZZZZ